MPLAKRGPGVGAAARAALTSGDVIDLILIATRRATLAISLIWELPKREASAVRGSPFSMAATKR